MHRRILTRWGLVAVLGASVACQLAPQGGARPGRRGPKPAAAARDAGTLPAEPTPVVPSPAVRPPVAPLPAEPPEETKPAVVPAEPVPPAGPSDTPEAPEPPRPVENPPEPNAFGSHCAEPPERAAARDGMRQFADDHAQYVAKLHAARDELVEAVTRFADDLPFRRIPAIAARFAERVAQIPQAPSLDAGLVENTLREAAFWTALCRALRDGRDACDVLEADDKGNARCCRSVERLVRLARRRPGGRDPLLAVGAFLGWLSEWQQDERIWQIVRDGEGEEACDGMSGFKTPERWHGPLCRALASRDASRCDALVEGWRARTCAALVHAILGSDAGSSASTPTAAEVLRASVSSPDGAAACVEALPRILSEAVGALDIFDPDPAVLPDVERARGMAPPP